MYTQYLKHPLVIALITFFVSRFFLQKEDPTKNRSNETKINDAIATLDKSIDRMGTDEEPIYEVFRNLTAVEIRKLNFDFGYRYYNKTLGIYTSIKSINDSFSKEMTLTQILKHELGTKELAILNEILVEKGSPIKL